MKVYVHYDSSGAIHGLIAANAPADRMPMLVPEPGLFVGEVKGEVPGWKHETDPPNLEALRKIAQTLRVAAPIPRCKLVRK
ncbi:MAG TPA: hypothetical protein VFH87_06655 [Candidatus Udaeobacter sp.]|nr:hypothetical protein [Candidatus Udaeobacter sp.]